MKQIIFLGIFLFILTIPFFGEVLYFQGSYDTNVLDKWLYIEKEKSGTKISTTNVFGGASEFSLDGAFNLRYWNYQDPKKKTGFQASYSSNIILIDGSIKGSRVHKEISTGGLPWCQDWGYCLTAFINSTNKILTFWSISPENLDYTSKFKAVKISNEIMTFQNKQIEVVYVKLSIEGVFSALFNADYWFRTSDGIEIMGKIPFPFGGKTYTEKLADSK